MEDFGYQKDDEPSNFSNSLKRNFLIGATLFSIACFVYITINAYYFVYQDENGNIETIKSPEGPIKVTEEEQAPANSDAQITNSIYDDIFGKKKESLVKIVPKIRTASEPAIPPKNNISGDEMPDRRLIKENSTLSDNKKSKDQRIIVYSDKTKETQGSKDLLTAKQPAAAEKTEEKPTQPATKFTSNTVANSKDSKKRVIRVQLAALSSKTSAEEYWKKLNRNNPSLFSRLKPFTEEVNLGKRGVFHRLQIGNFFNQNDAEEFCNRYILHTQKSRADCIIVE